MFDGMWIKGVACWLHIDLADHGHQGLISEASIEPRREVGERHGLRNGPSRASEYLIDSYPRELVLKEMLTTMVD